MTMLQEQAVQMIQDMSDDNVGFLIEVIQRLIPKKTYTSVIYPSQKPDEKMQAFKELVATRSEAKKYLMTLGIWSLIIGSSKKGKIW